MGSGDFFADMLEGLSHEMETSGFKKGGVVVIPLNKMIKKVKKTTKGKKRKGKARK